MAYLFEGRPGRLGCWMVHASNFGVFLLVELTLLQYETRISSLMFLAMGSYFVLPLIAASI